MQASEKIEEFAGQRILAEDPRTEKSARACVACGSNEARKLGTKNELDIVCCRRCRTLYTPYSPWYSSEYFYLGYYLKPEEVDTPGFVKTRLEEITAEFAPYRQTNRLLDLGCGAGDLLQAARKHAWQVCGGDVSSHASKHVRELGFEVFAGELQAAEFPDAHFDVITAAELLEHLFEPRALVGSRADTASGWIVLAYDAACAWSVGAFAGPEVAVHLAAGASPAILNRRTQGFAPRRRLPRCSRGHHRRKPDRDLALVGRDRGGWS